MFKMGKIFENLGENIQNLKTFWKVASVCVRLSHVINCYNHGNDILGLLMFYQIFLSPQMKRSAIINHKQGTYELPNDIGS